MGKTMTYNVISNGTIGALETGEVWEAPVEKGDVQTSETARLQWRTRGRKACLPSAREGVSWDTYGAAAAEGRLSHQTPGASESHGSQGRRG